MGLPGCGHRRCRIFRRRVAGVKRRLGSGRISQSEEIQAILTDPPRVGILILGRQILCDQRNEPPVASNNAAPRLQRELLVVGAVQAG